MTLRHAMLLVCDDLSITLNGKFNITGAYTADLVIGGDETRAQQLIFVFLIEGDLQDVPQSFAAEITFPGEEPRQFAFPLPPPPESITDGRSQWHLRLPFPIQMPLLRPGRIKAKVILDRTEIEVAGPWISKQSTVPTSPKASA